MAIKSLGLKLLALDHKITANTLTAIYYPDQINASDFISKMSDYDVLIAGGLLAEIKTTYFRVGHMGSVSEKDLITTLSAIEYALHNVGYEFELGISLKTFQKEIF